MSQGSPCPTCRNPMRWIPTMQQWGCDTCRVMYPAVPVAQPFAMAMTPKKGKGLVIGISALAIVGAAGAITLIAMQQKRSSGTAAPPAEGSAAEIGSAGSAVATVAPIKQVPMPPAPPAPPKDLSLGTPEQLELADLWITPRKDGAYVVTSPLLEVVFPHRPAAKVASAPPEVYTLSDDLQGRGNVQLQILPANAALFDAVKAGVAKVGTVIETHRSDRGTDVVRLEAASATSGETARVDIRYDTLHDLVFVATTSFIKSDQPTAEAFLDSVHLRAAPDPSSDPKALTVRVRKEHGRNEAHDATDAFKIDLPWTAKVARTPADPGFERVTVTSTRGKASVEVDIDQTSPWRGLAITQLAQQRFVDQARDALAQSSHLEVRVASEKLGGLPAARLDAKGRGHSYHTHLLWNRYQHRRYSIVCVDAPCDVVALSLKLAPPLPTP